MLSRPFQISCVLVFAIFFASSCGRDEKFPPIGLEISGPIDIAKHPSGEYFYVLNSDFTRKHNEGSILVINEEGERISSITTPRLGRHINSSGNIMVAGFGASGPDEEASVWLIDLSKPEAPEVIKRFPTVCPPINAVIEDGYPYFVVTCGQGQLYVGELKDDLADTVLHHVRRYGRERRALHLDRQRNLLYAFTTIMGDQDFSDLQADDVNHFDTSSNTVLEGANEVPDIYESTLLQRRQTGRRQIYQFVVYDLAAEAEAGFPFRAFDDGDAQNREIVTNELRWMYFTLTDADGHPDTTSGFSNLQTKHYRTNFWTAVPDPQDPNAFLLSHRSPPAGSYNISNNVIRVSVHGDPRIVDSQKPFTSDFFSFERVYGFSGEIDTETKLHFTGDIALETVNGRQLLVVNHFRDLVSFPRRDSRFSIAAKLLNDSFWHDELGTSNPDNSFYQIAMNQRGVLYSCAFYGDAVIRLEVAPGAAIREISRID